MSLDRLIATNHESRSADSRVLTVLAAMLLIALATLAQISTNPETESLTCTIAFGLFAFWVMRKEVKKWGEIGLVSPLSLYSFFWFLFYGIFGLSSFRQSSVQPLIGFQQHELIVADWVAFGSLALIASTYLFVTRTSPPSNLIRERVPYAIDIRPWAVYLCLSLGWVATVYAYARGQVGYITTGAIYSGLANHLLQATIGLVVLGLVTLAYVAWSPDGVPSFSRRHARILLLANLPLLVATSLASGFKAQLVTDLIPIGAMYLVRRRRLPWMAIGLLVVYLVLSYSGIQQFRQQVEVGQVTAAKSGGLVGLAQTVGSDIVHSRPTADPLTSASRFWDHFTQEENLPQVLLAAMLSHTPSQVPYIPATRYLTGPLFFLPTSWLPDGSFNSGPYVSVHYAHSTSSSAAPDPQPGDFFISGGYPFVIIGELLVGVVLGFLWRYASSSRVTGHRLIVYCVIAGSFANAGLDWVGLTRFILQTLIVYALVLRVMVMNRPNVLAGKS